MERGLARLPHPLDDDRERMQLRPEQPDDEVVVVLIEAVTWGPDGVPESGPSEGHATAAVLHEDRVLLLAREPLERARAAQRVPDRPPQLRIEHAAARPPDAPLAQT